MRRRFCRGFRDRSIGGGTREGIQPFFKQDEFSQGAGLGLSICQGIVQNLGGRIALSSKQGEGSRFSVVLPVYKGDSGAGSGCLADPRRDSHFIPLFARFLWIYLFGL